MAGCGTPRNETSGDKNTWGYVRLADWKQPPNGTLLNYGASIDTTRLSQIFGLIFEIATAAPVSNCADVIERARAAPSTIHVVLTNTPGPAGEAFGNIVCVRQDSNGLIAHEIGHVYGLPHKPDTLMAADGTGYDLGFDTQQMEVLK